MTLKWVLGALMGLVCITTLFNISGHSKLPATIATLVVGVALLRPSLIARVPAIVWKVYALAIIPLVLIDVMAKDTIPALLNLNTWLILFRCLNQSKRREEMQLALLCLFLIIMTGILTATLVFGLQLLVFAAIAIAYLVVGTALETKLEGDYDRLERIRQTSPMRVGKAVGSLFDLRFAFLSVALFSCMICVAGAVFLAIPRIDVEDKVNLFKMKSSETMTGFSDRIQLGDVTSIKNDDSVALRVDVPLDAELPAVPYWRMLALDHYEAGSFSLSNELVEMQRSPLASPYHSLRYWPDRRFSQVPSSDARDRWTFFLEPEVSLYLPIPGPFQQMTVPNLNQLSVGPHMHSFAMKEIGTKMFSYQVEGVDLSGRVPDVPANSYPVYPAQGSGNGERDNYPRTLLSLPRDEATALIFRQAAQEVTGGEELSAEQFAKRANEYLWRRHGYSMSVALPASDSVSDPVARWFRSNLSGHCEFFAASFTLMARAAGYPTRVVVGFKGGTWNGFENYFMVKNADAHAWVEIFDGVDTWIRVDPTPGSDQPDVAPVMVLMRDQVGASDSSAFVDSLRVLWYRRIVNFDEAAQKEAALQLKDFFLAYISVAREWTLSLVTYLYEWATAPWGFWRILYMGFLGALLVAAAIIQRNMALNFKELLLASFRRGDPIRRKASKILKRVAKRPSEDARYGEVLLNLQRLRYGAKESWPNPRLVFKAARRLR